MELKKASLAKLIDSTVLNPTATESDINDLFESAVSQGSQICVNECRLGQVVTMAKNLSDDVHKPLISTVIGFPLGAASTGIKVHSARTVLSVGADEIDMVANVAFLKEEKFDKYRADISAVADVVAEFNSAYNNDRVLKVIIETCYLTDDEKRRAAATIASISRVRGLAMFVKTSTGFGSPAKGVAKGATIADVALLRKESGPYHPTTNRIGVKASGGIKTRQQALDFVNAACATNANKATSSSVRIGTSSAAAILAD